MSWKAGALIAVGMLLAGCGGTAAPSATAAGAVSSAPASAVASKPASTAAGSVAASSSASAKPVASGAAKPAASSAAKPAAVTSTAPIPSSPPSSNAENGKALFAKDGCYECHDYQGQGGQGTGPKLAPNPLPWVAFAAQVRTPRQDMPKYPLQFLSDQDLGDIYAYMQAVPAPPNPSSLPLLTNR